jgi:hypothetical protein
MVYTFYYYYYYYYYYYTWSTCQQTCIIKFTRSNRGVHGPVRSGFNIKNQPNRKILFLVNITRTEPRTGSNRPVLFGSGRFFSLRNQKNRNQLNKRKLSRITITGQTWPNHIQKNRCWKLWIQALRLRSERSPLAESQSLDLSKQAQLHVNKDSNNILQRRKLPGPR